MRKRKWEALIKGYKQDIGVAIMQITDPKRENLYMMGCDDSELDRMNYEYNREGYSGGEDGMGFSNDGDDDDLSSWDSDSSGPCGEEEDEYDEDSDSDGYSRRCTNRYPDVGDNDGEENDDREDNSGGECSSEEEDGDEGDECLPRWQERG